MIIIYCHTFSILNYNGLIYFQFQLIMACIKGFKGFKGFNKVNL